LVGIWRTPNSVLLHQGIKLDAGTPEPIVIPFETCGGGLCQAVVKLNEDFIKALSTAQKATATIVPVGGDPVTLTLSVNGLADGLAALREQQPATAAQ